MKIALYIEDGLEQIVLTPESKTEEAILGKMHDGTRQLSIERGTFYACRGGWIRWKQKTKSTYPYFQTDETDESTMIVLREAPSVPESSEDIASQL